MSNKAFQPVRAVHMVMVITALMDDFRLDFRGSDQNLEMIGAVEGITSHITARFATKGRLVSIIVQLPSFFLILAALRSFLICAYFSSDGVSADYLF